MFQRPEYSTVQWTSGNIDRGEQEHAEDVPFERGEGLA